MPPDVAAAFERLVASVTIGGDEPERFAEIRLTDKRERVVFPRETMPETVAVVRYLMQNDVVASQRSDQAVFDEVRTAAQSAAESGLRGDALTAELEALLSSLNAGTGSIRSLYVLAPRLHFPEESVQVGKVTIYRATDAIMRARWPQAEASTMREHLTQEIRDRYVAEVANDAERIRAHAIAAEQVGLAVALLGLAYTNLYRDWPAASLLPSDGVHALSVHPDGGMSWGPVQFFDQPLMQYPTGYLPSFLQTASDGRRLASVLAGTRRDEVDSRLLSALRWWAAGNDTGPWAMRFVKYVTALEALFNRTTEPTRGKSRRFARRVALMVASPRRESVRSLQKRLRTVYRVRSECVHEGAVTVNEADAYEVMRIGAICISYLARSTLSSESDLCQHIDAMDRSGEPWVEYGWKQKIDPGQ